MASSWYTRGLYEMASGIVYTTAGLKLLLVDANYTFDKDHDYVSDVVANELTGTGYTGGFGGSGRKSLATKTLTLDDTNDRIVLDADDLTWSGINAGTAAAAILFRELTNDASSPLWAYLDPANVVTNGGDVTLIWNAAGILRIQN